MNRNTGLKPTPKDKRDYSLHRNFGSPQLPQLPDEFFIEGDVEGPRDQGVSLFCTAYTVTENNSDIDGVPYDENYQAAMTGRVQGEMIINGADLRSAVSAPTKYGLLPKNFAPYQWQRDGQNIAADWTKYSQSVIDEAKKHLAPAYFSVDGPYDAFDNIRVAVWNHKPKRGVMVGTPWLSSFNVGPDGIVPKITSGTIASWHAWDIKGYKIINGTKYLVARQWEGENWGDKGYCYFDRETINHLFSIPGSAAFMYQYAQTDTPDTVQVKTIIGVIRQVVANLLSINIFIQILNIFYPPMPPKIVKLAQLISRYEGNGPTDRATRNCNPGNCRYSPVGYLKKYQPVRRDADGFAIFPSMSIGWLYLENLLISWAKGPKANYTILQVMKDYAPGSDGNNPVAYAAFLTKELGVDSSTKLSDLLKT